jgi:hypothetical protein
MAKSKKRGGATTHRKRVTARNQQINSEIKQQQAFFKEAMMEQLQKLKEQKAEENETKSN